MSTDSEQTPRTSVSLAREGGLARLTLVPPEGKPPTLDHEVLGEFEAALAELEASPPRMLVVDSASERTFCAGANLRVLRETDTDTIVPWVEAGHRALARLEDLPFPVVARVSGHALGGGLELALACDLIYATDTARLGLTEANLGFVPGWGGSFRLPERVGPAHAKRMFFQAAVLTAEEALRIGLVDVTGTAAEIDTAIQELGRKVESLGPAALGGFKILLGDARRAAREAGRIAEATASVACLLDPETQQRVTAFLEKRS